MFDLVCLAPSCDGLLPEYSGRGRPRKWCSPECQRKAEVMASHYRRGTLGVRADEWRSLGYPEHGAKLDAWLALFEGSKETRR